MTDERVHLFRGSHECVYFFLVGVREVGVSIIFLQYFYNK